MNDKIVSQLARIESKRFSLITVYVPPRKPLFEVIASLKGEIGIATNIHDQETREEATHTLVMVVEFLKQYDKLPLVKGLIVFCGYFPLEGDWQYRLFDFVPDDKIEINLYRCDNRFYTDYLTKPLASGTSS
jgi:peptide chain release factor subunit 1